MSVLKVRKIDFEEVDISDPTREADKLFMREKTPPKEGRNVPLPPQIFNSDVYCGVGMNFKLRRFYCQFELAALIALYY